MAVSADYPVPLDQMTDAELYAAALAVGISFRLAVYTLDLADGPKRSELLETDLGLLGRDRARLLRVAAIDPELRRRRSFAAYVKARQGVVVIPPRPSC